MPFFRQGKSISQSTTTQNMSSTSDTINIKGNRKVIRATYFPPESIFKIPDGLDLEDKSIVKWWGVKYNRLYIHYVDGREEDIYPTLDAMDSSDFKHPQETEIVDADDCGCIEYSDEEDDVVFHCFTCKTPVIRDSETHDYSKCDPYAEDNWYCPECPVPDSEDEDEEVEEVDRA